MAQAPWLDFTQHNATTGENVRAFAVNHPQAGRLVVIKGVSGLYEAALQALRFSQTRDGSWVIRARDVNLSQLQSQVFPAISLRTAELEDFDLTNEFLQGLNQQQTQSQRESIPSLEWLARNTQDANEDGTLQRYRGPLPSALAVSLWSHLDEFNPGERQPNGQIHYRGEHNGNAYLIQRRQRLLGSVESVIYHQAQDARFLPDLSASSQAPALFRLSDSVAEQLREVDQFYSHSQGGEPHNHFSPSRALADARGQTAINATDLLEGELIKAELPTAHPLVIANSEFEPVISVSRLTEILGADDTQALLGGLPAQAWERAPEAIAQVAASPEATLYASALVMRPEMTRIAAERGFDSLVYYRRENTSADLQRDAFIDESGVALEVRAVDPADIKVVLREPRINQSLVPNGYEVAYGRGEREGQISLIHNDSGEAVTFEGKAWFSDAAAAIAAISAPENQPVVAPSDEDISAAMDEAFTTVLEPIEVIAYRGEHGKPDPENPLQTRLGSISFGSLQGAEIYAREPNRRADRPVEPRVIEARLRINNPVPLDEEDPFIDMALLAQTLGEERAKTIALAVDGYIRNTSNWEDVCRSYGYSELPGSVEELLNEYPEALHKLYADVYAVLDEPEWIGWLQEAGYDGAVHAGASVTAMEREYKIFSPEQAEILNVRTLDTRIQATSAAAESPGAAAEDDIIDEDSTLGERTRADIAGVTAGRASLVAVNNYLDAWVDDYSVPLQLERSVFLLTQEIATALDGGDIEATRALVVREFTEWLGEDLDSDIAEEVRALRDIVEDAPDLTDSSEFEAAIEAGLNSSEDPTVASEPEADIMGRGESAYRRLTSALSEDSQLAAQLTMPEVDRDALASHLQAQGYTRTEEKNLVVLTSPSQANPEHVVLASDTGSVRIERTDPTALDATQVRETLRKAISTLSDHGTTLHQLDITFGQDNALYQRSLGSLRGEMIESLQTIARTLREIRARGGDMNTLVEGTVPDLIALGDPIITELYDQIIDDDVPLVVEPLNVTAPDPSLVTYETSVEEPEEAPQTTLAHRKEALTALTQSRSFADAGLEIRTVSKGWEADFNGATVASGTGRVNRARVIESLLTELEFKDELNSSLYQSIRDEEALMLEYQDVLDPLFKERIASVRHTLAAAGFQMDHLNPNIHAPQSNVRVDADYDLAGQTQSVVGVTWRVVHGSTLLELEDTLALTPEQLAEEITASVIDAERAIAAEAEQPGKSAPSPTPTVYSLSEFIEDGPDSVRKALSEGNRVTHDDREYRVEHRGHGWVMVERQGEYAVSKGGDPRGSGFGQGGAIDAAMEELEPYLDLLKSERTPTTESDADASEEPSASPDTPSAGQDGADVVDLFGGGAAPSQPAGEPRSRGVPVRLMPGINEKQILVKFPGELGEQTMSDVNGRYVKKYDAYRVKKSLEPRLRRALQSLADNEEVAVTDTIRTPIALKEGLVLTKKGSRHDRAMTVSSIKPSRYEAGHFDVTLKSDSDALIQMEDHTDTISLESTYNVAITNWEELERRFAREADVNQTVADLADRVLSAVDNQDSPELNDAEESDQDSEFDRQYPIIRGMMFTRIGRNTEGETLFSANSGLRVAINANNELREETPLVAETGEFLPPANRENGFKTISELSAETAEVDNVVSLHRATNEQDDALQLGDDDSDSASDKLNEMGIDSSLLGEYLRAHHRLVRHEELEAQNPTESGQFVQRRLSRGFDQAESNLINNAAQAGYSINRAGLNQLADKDMERYEELAERMASTIYSTMFERHLSEINYLTREFVSEIPANRAKMIPGYWLKDKLEQAKRASALPEYTLLVAKAYGTPQEVADAEAIGKDGNPEALKALADRLDERYQAHRATVEIPSQIRKLTEDIKDYTGLSPIPADNMRRQVSRLYEELARAMYDIDALPIEAADIEAYRSHTADGREFEALAERHDISVDAAKLYCKRVEAEIGRRSHAEFLERPETLVGLEAAEKIKDKLPEGVTVTSSTDSFNDGLYPIKFDWGAGDITVGYPEKARELGDGYTVDFNYHEEARGINAENVSESITYANLPSAEQIVSDTLSMAARYQASTRLYKAPRYGSRYSELGENSYDNTLIAKNIRTDIKNAIKAGDLPQGLKVSVRKSGGAINVEVTGLPDGFDLFTPEFLQWEREGAHLDHRHSPARYNREGSALMAAINRYVDAYNFDKSDRMTDYHNVNYYSFVRVDSDLEKAEKGRRETLTGRREDDNTIYPMVPREAYLHIHQLMSLGVTYVGERRVAFDLVPGGALSGSIDGDGMREAPEAVQGRTGLTDEATAKASEPLRLAYTLLKDAYALENRPFFSEEAAPAETPAATNPAVQTLNRVLNSWALTRQIPHDNALNLTLSHTGTGEDLVFRHADDELVIAVPGAGTVNERTLGRFDTSTTPWTVTEQDDELLTTLAALEYDYTVSTREVAAPESSQSAEATLQVDRELSTTDVRSIHSSRLDRFHSLSVTPTPVPVVTTNGSHFVGAKRMDDDTYTALISSTLQAGQYLGVTIEASGHGERDSALIAAGRALDEYAALAYEENQAPGIVEAVSILRQLEQSVGDNRFQSALITDEERRVAARGGSALNDYYESLIEKGASGSFQRITVLQQVDLPPAVGGLGRGRFELGQLANGRFIIGASIPLADDNGLSVPLTASNVQYASATAAIAGFASAVEHHSPSLADNIVDRYLRRIEGVLPVMPGREDRLVPDLSEREVSQRKAELPQRITQLQTTQADTTDQDESAQLMGEIDALQQQLDDAHARELVTLIARQNARQIDVIDDLSIGFVHQIAQKYPEVRYEWNRYHIQRARLFGPEPDAQVLNQWAIASDLVDTHTPNNEQGFDHKQTLAELPTLTINSHQRNPEANPVYSVLMRELDGNAQSILANQARVAGALVEDGEILFSSLEAVDAFVEENDLRYTLQSQTVGNHVSMDTNERLANISTQLERDLNAQGYIRTSEPNVWVTQSTNGGSVRLSFFRGIDGETSDVRLNYGREQRRIEEHFTGFSKALDIDTLEGEVNGYLSSIGEGPLASPAPEPSIGSITPEQVAQVLLGAGLNMSDRNDGTWEVSGDTFRYRHFLTNLGADYQPGTSTIKPHWLFKHDASRQLASAIAGQIPQMGTTQNVVDGYILTIEHSENDNCFVTVLSKPDDERRLVLTIGSSLMSVRASGLKTIVDSEKLDSLWEKAYGETAQVPQEQLETVTVEAEAQEPTADDQAQADALVEARGNETSEPRLESSPTQENDYVRQTERSSGGAGRNGAASNAPSDDGREPGVDHGSVQRAPEGVAGQGRGANRPRAGSDSQPRGADARRGSQVDTGGSIPDSTSATRSPVGDDERVRRSARDHQLFDLISAQGDTATSDEAKAQASYQALRTLLTLREEKRAATEEEKVKLSNMVGLGASAFHGGTNKKIFGGYSQGDTASRIRDLLRQFNKEERDSLQSTVLSAFYTPPELTRFMWDGLERMGVNASLPSLDIVEPAVGTGNFLGHAPEFVRRQAQIRAIEADPITAEIAQHLYPEANILNKEFQDALLPANTQDVFIGNPPYGDVRVYNPSISKREVIHDMFLRESVRATRPGGIVTFVTSSGTMDKGSDEMRQYLYTQADLVGAFRLPNSAFKEHAGTEVMTDVLFFRKRKPEEEPLNGDWVHSDTTTFEINDTSQEARVNRHFINNPHHVLGELHLTTGRFGYSLACRAGDTPIEEQLQTALQSLPEDIFAPQRAERRRTQAALIERTIEDVPEDIAATLKVGNLFVLNDQIRSLEYDGIEGKYVSDVAPIRSKDIPMIKAYVALRDVMKELINAETEVVDDFTEQRLTELRNKADTLYDEFVSDFGPIGRRDTLKALRIDPDLFFVAQVEHYDADTDQAEKADILSKRVIQAMPTQTIDTPSDAVFASMSRYGYIDPEFCSGALGKPWDTIAESLGDAIYFDPEEGYYTTDTVYLSGDVIAKREAAERALVHDSSLQRNIDALKEATPKPIPITEIRVKLGAMWIPDSIVSDFMRRTLHATGMDKHDKCFVKFNQLSKRWVVKATPAILRDGRVANEQEFGTNVLPFHKILKNCLEQTRPKVTVEDSEGRRHVDVDATQAARDKQALIEESFQAFILEDPERAEQMEKAYNYRMNRFVLPEPDGRYLEFPGITQELKGRPFKHGDHQLAAIERSITEPYGLLLAHEAGGGKTITTTCAAIKNKQLGLANKPLVGVPNHMLVQYTREVLGVYPNARVLTVSQNDLTREGREAFAHKVRLNDWDLIICTHEQFKKMQMPDWFVKRQIDNEVAELEEAIAETDDRTTTKQLEGQKKNLKEKLKEMHERSNSEKDDIDFTELGIDWIGYDESHLLKNRAFPTKNTNLAGVQSITSQRARDAEMKFDWIREYRGDERGVLLATGTPICNTIGEVMVAMRYLAPTLLERAGIRNFDAFMAAFGETQVHVELTPDGSSYQMKERLSRFHNVPELMRLFTQVADIKMGDALNLTRPDEKRVTEVSEMAPEQRLFMDWLAERAQNVKDGSVKPHEDNMLKIYSDLGTMSIDPRLYHHKLQDHAESKINLQVESMYQAWKEGKDTLSTQLVFLDQYQAKEAVPNGHDKKGLPRFKTIVHFNLYDDIKEKLIDKGVPSEDIAFIHDAKTDDDKEALFSNMRAGKVRICLASTAKMGVGTNVQTRLKDLRHLSYPMRSIDIEQRNKRAVRQGNMHDEVNVHYPTTKDSGDLSRLQMLDRKEQMTRQIMYCDFENMERTFEEEVAPTYEDIMAITTGNTLIKEKLDVDTTVDTLRRQCRTHEQASFRAKRDYLWIETRSIPQLEDEIEASKKLASAIGKDTNGFAMTIKDQTFTKAGLAGAEVHRLAAKMTPYESEKLIGEYRDLPLYITKDSFGQHCLTVDSGGQRIGVQVTDKLSYFPSSLGMKLRDAVQDAERCAHRIEELKAEAKQLKEISQKPFPHVDKLQAAEKRQSEMSVELAKLEQERSKNKDTGREEGELHPFETLILSLDGETVQRKSILNEEEIQAALNAEENETREVEMEKGGQVSLLTH